MAFAEYLCSELKKYHEVIIYGFADIGACVLDYIIDFETSIKIANYSGRVKYFAHSYDKKARKEKKGIKIRSIYELEDFSERALVIVAVQEQHHSDITVILDSLGFHNRLFITHEAYCELREKVENHRNIIDSRIMQYHLNHAVKLDRLREKVKNGGKAKVFFLTHDAAVFGCASVYKAMEKNELFDPYLFVISRRDITDINFYNDVLQDVRFFEEKGYRVICGYDKNKNPLDLHQFSPDILFYDIPKLYGAAGNFYFRLDQLNWEYLTCYVPYGLLMVDSFYYHYHTTCIRETWRFFLDTAASFKRVLADGEFSAFNTVLSGYPKFDDYNNGEDELPLKLQNNNPTIIYAPHHSLGVSNNFATFDLYKELMLEAVRKHPDINFVFKPHPLLPFQINRLYASGKVDFSQEDYRKYMEEWDGLPNGICITKGDYIGIFKRSCCMITDCGSFIGEYFPSLNPCIYLFNPRKKYQEDVYTPLAAEILDTYYIVHSAEELGEAMEEVAFKGMDAKRESREKLFVKEFGDIGHSGNVICEHIRNQIVS